MLNTKEAMATVAVREMKAARKFYGEILGLEELDSMEDVFVSYKSGSSTLLVYKSEFAGTNRATSATWNVGSEIDAIARSLKAKGVKFEHYDMPNMTLDGDVYSAGPMKAAWFADPDGNILNLSSGGER